MRAPQIVSDFFEWRWAPCVALTVGSLAYVGLAVLFIPSQIDGSAHAGDVPSAFDRSSSLPNAAFAASLANPTTPTPSPRSDSFRRPPSPQPAAQAGANDPVGAPRRGFSPPIEQPETPPPPPPVPPPAAQVAPTPAPPPANVAPPSPPPDQAAPPPAPPAPAGDEPAPPQPTQ